MLTAPSDRYQQDAAGEWWYRRRSGRRLRAMIVECVGCRAGVLTLAGPNSSRFCPSCRRLGHRNGSWKGGTFRMENGYLSVWTGKGTRDLEHRVVMAALLGRPLLPNETVHHINGIKDDNRPDNLELWVKPQPAGQRLTAVGHCPTCRCTEAG